jgi:hypothetical protein
MTSNFLSLNPSKTEFLLLGLPHQLAKLQNPKISLPGNVVLCPVTSARNLGVIFDSNLSFSEHISAISKSCFQHIRDLRRIRNTINLSTACTIASSLIHSKLDYCNSLLLNLPTSSLKRFQFVLNSAARAVTNTSKFSHITPVLKSLHWLKIEQRIHYKILSLTHKALDTNRPTYLRSLLTVQDIRNTRSASIVSLVHPTNPSRLKITNRSFFIWLLFSGIAFLLIFVLAPNVLQEILQHLLLHLLCLLLNSMLNSNLISSIILFLLDFFLFCWTDPSGS